MAAELKRSGGGALPEDQRLLGDLSGHLDLPGHALFGPSSGWRGRAGATYHLLVDALRRCHGVHADETGWRIGRVNAWLWVFSSPTVTIYATGTPRGHEVPEEILGADFEGILVVDGLSRYNYNVLRCLSNYNVLRCLKGRCVGHVLRQTGRLAETLTGIDLYFLTELTGLLREAIDPAERRETMTHAGYFRRVKERECVGQAPA